MPKLLWVATMIGEHKYNDGVAEAIDLFVIAMKLTPGWMKIGSKKAPQQCHVSFTVMHL